MSDLRRHRHVVKSLRGWILFVVTNEADLLVRYDQTHGSEFNRSSKQATMVFVDLYWTAAP